MAIENKLSDKLLKSLVGKRQDKQKTIADGRGLSVRVSMVGGISFVFYYRLGGRESPPVWLTLGRYPDMSLATARRMRDQCREWLAENLDPRRQIKLAAEKTMQPVTVRDALFYWYDNHATTARKEHEYLIKRFEKHIFPYIGDMAIEQCKLHTWLTVFDRIKKNAPVMSGAIFLDIKQALRFCRVRQYIACDPFGDINVSYVGRSSGIRDRVLNINETADVWSYAYGNNLLTLSSIYNRRIMVIRKTGTYGIPWGALQDFSRRKEQYQISASEKGRELQACKRKKRELEEEEKTLIREYQPEFYFGNRIQ